MIDDNHFSFSHARNKKTAVIYRSDGQTFNGPRDDFGFGHLPEAKGCSNVIFGNGYAEFGGKWRIGAMSNFHFSLGHKDGFTPIIWAVDGVKHFGPRKDYNPWTLKD